MTMLEDRLRDGLAAEAEAWRDPSKSGIKQAVSPVAGIRIALVAAAAIFVVVGSISIVSRGSGIEDAPVFGSDPSRATVAQPTDTVLAQEDSTGPFEAIPFSGETWQFTVGEDDNRPLTTYKVCYSFIEPGEPTEASGLGISGCGDWPSDTTTHLIDVTPVFETDAGVVLLIDLTHNPVHNVRVVRDSGSDIDLSPFRMPGSGKQFAVVELPDRAGSITVELTDESGGRLETSALIYVGEPDAEWAAAAIELGAEPVSDEEIQRIDQWMPFVPGSGYRISQTTQETPVAAELGVVIYKDPGLEGDDPWYCVLNYAIVDGTTAAGGSRCAATPAEFGDSFKNNNLAGGGSCGPIPKDSPKALQGAWTLIGVWALPDGLDTVEVSVVGGGVVSVPVTSGGAAQMLWHDSVTITSVEYAGMTTDQFDYAQQILPAAGIDCTPDSGNNG